MDKAFGELSVVKRAYTGDEAKHQRDCRVRSAFGKRRRWYNRPRRQCGTGRNGALQPGCEAVLAENYTFDITLAALAQRLPAGPAISGRGNIWMDGAVHASPPGVQMENSSFIVSNTPSVLSVVWADLFRGKIARNKNN